MVDWMSPAEIMRDAQAFDRFMHALLGVYMWEWAISLSFDWRHLSQPKKFKWPLIFYFLNRYCLFFALIGIAIALNVTEEVNCQGLYTFNQCFGNAAIGLASINLSLRTIAVWKRSPYIVIPLIAVILGHWSLLLHGILLKAAWVPGQGCVITQTDNKLLAATFIYSMCFDFSILCLTAFKLMVPNSETGRLTVLSSTLGHLIFNDGFLANLIATIFMLLNLNPVMSIIANVPAAICSTIVACRCVRRLSEFSEKVELMDPRNDTSARSGVVVNPNSHVHRKTNGTEVFFEMNTLHSPTDNTLYDAAGHPENDKYDHEAQASREDFKRPPY
ncbi:hypothetical protein CPC08DRAFT_738330 [Agrocybe pediades]|nr:hypothetical protein CPC08DRAFT_738330 [Agrocybe pediades]